MSDLPPDPQSSSSPISPAPRRSRRGWLIGLGAFALFMVAFAFINIPLFKTFCEHFGIAIAPVNAAVAAPAGVTRQVTIMFTGEVGSGLRMAFHPAHAEEKARIGQRMENHYTFINDTGHTIQFRAIHSLYPFSADQNVAIMKCFCFSQQSLGPHQSRTLPVVYQINPGLKKSVHSISWNYTLFPIRQ